MSGARLFDLFELLCLLWFVLSDLGLANCFCFLMYLSNFTALRCVSSCLYLFVLVVFWCWIVLALCLHVVCGVFVTRLLCVVEVCVFV